MILRHVAGATGNGGGKSGGAGSRKTHLVVSVGCVVLEECDTLAVQAPIVPLPLWGEVFEGDVVGLGSSLHKPPFPNSVSTPWALTSPLAPPLLNFCPAPPPISNSSWPPAQPRPLYSAPTSSNRSFPAPNSGSAPPGPTLPTHQRVLVAVMNHPTFVQCGAGFPCRVSH